METLDKQKLLEWLRRNDDSDDTNGFEIGWSACCRLLIDEIESGEFNTNSAN